MNDHPEQVLITRAVRQRLESLRRAGVDRIPSPPVFAAIERAVPAPSALTGPITVLPEPAPPDPVPEPPRPAPPAVPISPPIAASLFGEPQIEPAVVPVEERPALLDALSREVAGCTRCPVLVASRTRTVFGIGTPSARLMFVGEAPGADEDRQGVPFVGRSGQLLTDMITKGMGLTRDEVYIANVIKSRPPENRAPLPDEVANCLPYLERQIAIIRPAFLCLLGKVAASALLDTALPIGRLRGRWHRYKGIPAVVTYHPSYLLRTPAAKKDAWDDLQMLMQAMGLKVPDRKKGRQG